LLTNVSLVSANMIVTQPVSQTICKSQGDATFSVTVSGSQTSYTYQWYELVNGSWNMLPTQDAKGPGYTTHDEGTYRCVVTLFGTTTSETSQPASLIIHDVPFITGIIASEVCSGGDLVAAVDRITANGSDLQSYEWKLGGVTVESGTVSNNTVPDLVYTVTAVESGKPLWVEIRNGCGTTASSSVPIIVWSPPPPPTPVTSVYCEGDAAAPLTITESGTAVWYDAPTGGSVIAAPAPDTSTPGTQTWWVSQKVTYSSGPVCESNRTSASVTVRPLSDIPDFAAVIDLCLNDPDTTLKAAGTGVIKWYDQQKGSLPTAPQINTSTAGEQTYYVTQTKTGECESPIDNGKITVLIRSRANMDAVELSYTPELCPNNSTVIEAVSQVSNSTFRWYAHNDKTGLIHTGSTFTTPVLMRDTTYYVTVQYLDMCESSYPESAMINVSDHTLPRITAPPSLVVSTGDGVCYAANVDTGQPLVSDNCTDMSNLLVYTDPVAPVTYHLGDTTLTWWVMDEAGNKDKALQTISVRDREKPKGTCPEDIIIELDEDENSAVVTYNLNYTDNCSPVKYVMETTGTASGSVFNLGTTPVKYEITDSAGNTETCEFNVIVRHPYRPMEVALRVNAYEVCPGGEVVVSTVISGGSGTYVYSWKPGVWNKAVLSDYPLTSTVYEVTVSDGITTQTKDVQVTVLEIPQVALTLEGRPMDEIFEGNEVLVTATPGFASYKLLLDNKVVQEAGLNNSVSFQAELGPCYVRVFATDVNFCTSQDQLRIDVTSKKLPNIFTPNKDGKNDIFLEGFDLQVFSRAGELLYKGVNGWDGVYKGKLLPQGTYLYVVKRTMNNGEQRIFKGTVTLKR
jgi:gliding motility-associated-like protein